MVILSYPLQIIPARKSILTIWNSLVKNSFNSNNNANTRKYMEKDDSTHVMNSSPLISLRTNLNNSYNPTLTVLRDLRRFRISTVRYSNSL